MTTFTELQCFNKLLLDKMKRMEEELNVLKKFKNEHLEDQQSYSRLLDFCEYHGFLEDAFCCDECNEWTHMDNYAHNESGSCDCAYVCKDCDDNVNWCCDGCSTHFCLYWI